MSRSSEEFPEAHAILKSALLAVEPENRPPGPFAAGGPTPTCPALGQICIAVWCAELFEKSVPAAERQIYDDALALTRHYLTYWNIGGKAPAGAKQRNVFETLRTAAAAGTGKDTPASIACSAAGGARSMSRSKADLVFSSVQGATVRAARLLASGAFGTPMTVAAFLSALDEEILRLECEASFQLHAAEDRARVARVLWRASGTGSKKGAAHFLARLDNGRYGLVTKIKNRWSWFEGSRDDALSTMPEFLFAAATKAALDRDSAPAAKPLTPMFR